jgi:hypothetical protein
MYIERKIFALKFVHSVVFFFMDVCLFYFLYCAIFRRYDWTLLVALGAISAEGLALLFNRGRCPLTTLAERFGAAHGAVTDIFLPGWLARNTFKISIVLVIIGLALLARGFFAK